MPAIMLMVIGVLAVVANYINSVKDTQQKDNIERLGNENKNLSIEIKALGTLNEDLSKKIEKIVTENQKASDQSLLLSQQSKELISEVKKLTIKVDQTTANQAAENKQSGELIFNKRFSDITSFIIGGNSFDISLKEIEKGEAKLFKFGDREPISLKVVDNKLLLSMQVFDLKGNLIAEIEDNFWRPNRNFTGKYNYDDKGFEVLDNEDNIAVNINITDSGNLEIQGIFPYKDSGTIMLCGSNGLRTLSFNNLEFETIINKKYHMSYDDYFNKCVKEVKIRRLFNYTGNDWLHKRNK